MPHQPPAATVRAWAVATDWRDAYGPIATRGRLPRRAVDDYLAAHPNYGSPTSTTAQGAASTRPARHQPNPKRPATKKSAGTVTRLHAPDPSTSQSPASRPLTVRIIIEQVIDDGHEVTALIQRLTGS